LCVTYWSCHYLRPILVRTDSSSNCCFTNFANLLASVSEALAIVTFIVTFDFEDLPDCLLESMLPEDTPETPKGSSPPPTAGLLFFKTFDLAL
jgi:hypothetical protein